MVDALLTVSTVIGQWEMTFFALDEVLLNLHRSRADELTANARQHTSRRRCHREHTLENPS